VFEEAELMHLLESRDWRNATAVPSDPHTLHIVRRSEGDWVLVSRSTDAEPVVKEAQPLFAAAERDWLAQAPVEDVASPET
jgi:hypothetical protein